ncbi:fibronectin type III domain-containing protein [Amycolatopsis sp. NPDC059027]|uniref:fibronectin type III domain-containing protein n=1 Tax=unclassified Amycolatopsis TaxID=2618356 RepID=UPI00366B807A
MTAGGRAWRRRVPVVLIAVTCGATVTVALTGAAKPLGGMQFLPVGHWVYNLAARAVFHVDGATSSVDAQTPVPGDPGSQVVQGDSSGYVVGQGRITEFGKSNLAVEPSIVPPTGEVAVGVETAGGPYLVYREAGRVVRLGHPPASMSAGGPVGDPVATSNGTLWLFRKTSALLCDLVSGADQLSACPVSVPAGHTGALTLVADQPWFVDTTAAELRPVGAAGLGAPLPLGVTPSRQANPAANDVSGRVAILDRQSNRLYFVDTTHRGEKPVIVELPEGDYSDPVSTGRVVALVDKKSGTLLTYDATGRKVGSQPIPPESGIPRVSRGEDGRVYVDGAEGAHVLVVDHDGKIVDVPIGGDRTGDVPKPQNPPDGSVVPPVEQRRGGTDGPVAPPGGQGQQRPGPGAGDRQGPPGRQEPQNPVPPKPAPPAAEPPKTQPTAPASPPGAPSSVSATAGSGSATVSWGAAPDNRAPITSYRISWAGGSQTVGGDARSANISGLANGTRYTMTVTAVNKAGTGPGASATVTPVAAAGAPPNLTARPQGTGAVVSWGAPAMNGGTLVHYVISATGKGSQTTNGTSMTYGGLSGSVTFTVYAVTKTADGQTLNGASSSKTIQIAAQGTITISQGAPGSSDNCKRPNCYWINASLKGFAPNTRYTLRLSSDSNPKVHEEDTTPTDANGSVNYNKVNYDVPGQTVWITVLDANGRALATSNKIKWEKR